MASPMRILFASFRHDPLATVLENGADHQFLNALQAKGVEIRVIGPFDQPAVFPERALRRIMAIMSKGKFHKYDLINTFRASRETNIYSDHWKPDLIFTLYPPPLVFYKGVVPCVFRTDATFLGSRSQAPEFHQYGSLALKMNTWMEKKAFAKSAKIITHSEWSAQSLMNDYKVKQEKIFMFPNPSSIPDSWIPSGIDISAEKKFNGPIRLLFIGRDPYRKGLDIAIEIVKRLNDQGLPSMLTICGLDGENQEHLKYV